MVLRRPHRRRESNTTGSLTPSKTVEVLRLGFSVGGSVGRERLRGHRSAGVRRSGSVLEIFEDGGGEARAEALQRAVVSHHGAVRRDREQRGDLLVRAAFDSAEDQHLAIDRLELREDRPDEAVAFLGDDVADDAPGVRGKPARVNAGARFRRGDRRRLRFVDHVFLEQVADAVDQHRARVPEQSDGDRAIAGSEARQRPEHPDPDVRDDVFRIVEAPQRRREPLVRLAEEERREPRDEPRHAGSIVGDRVPDVDRRQVIAGRAGCCFRHDHPLPRV